MSEGNAIVDTMEKCYKCEEPLGYDPEDSVHPLCEACEEDFVSWFERELMILNG